MNHQNHSSMLNHENNTFPIIQTDPVPFYIVALSETLTQILNNNLSKIKSNQSNSQYQKLAPHELLINNMYIYQHSVPDFVKIIFDMDTNPYYLIELDENTYSTLAKLPHYKINKITQILNEENSLNSDDMFITLKVINNDPSSIEIVTHCKYNPYEHTPFHYNLLDDGLLCDFIDPISLQDKIIITKTRYLTYDVNLFSEIQTAGHSIIVIFDTYAQTAYLLDSNGSFDYFNNSKLGINHTELIHAAMEYYCIMIGYKYTKLTKQCIKYQSNHKINSVFQKPFFKGYCVGWTMFFKYMLANAPDTFEFIQFIKDFQHTDIGILNQLVEIFMVWYYNSFNTIITQKLC
jgi:hypothetical protein